MSDSLIGTTLLGRYRILDRIGAGAMGAVYRAQQVGLDRAVALKVLKRQHNPDSDMVARFEREAKAMSALVHPNTVRVYDFGATSEGMMFLAMELLEGELATAHLERVGAASIARAITWTQQVLRSVGEAHAKGIIHRDIKPDNIFLARAKGVAEPIAKVLDFGIAKAIEGEHKLDQFETLDGTVFGTPRYMSPEQAQGKALDHRSDLYAVGIVLYEMLVGAPPFIDRDAVVVMAKHIRDDPPALRQAAPDRTFPADLQRVIDKALNKAAALRFQSAEEFDRALERCLRDAELLERVPLRSRKWLGHALAAPRWMRWTLGAAAVCGLALAVTLFALDNRRATIAAEAPMAVPALATQDVEPPPAKPLAEAPPELHTVSLYSEPGGANVWNANRFVGVTPLPLEVQAGQTLRVRISMSGFQSQTLDLTSAETERVVKLEPTGGVAAPPTQVRTRSPKKPPRHVARDNAQPHAKTAPDTSDAYEKF